MKVAGTVLFVLILLSGCTGKPAAQGGLVPEGPPEVGPVGVFLPGTQPNQVVFDTQIFCYFCHGNYSDYAPYDTWRGSMMGHAARDPLVLAAMASSNKDLGEHVLVGDYCLRCHTPKGWLEGRSEPVDGSALEEEKEDLDGVICDFCHRMVDPMTAEGRSLPTNGTVTAYHNAQFVVSDKAVKRGPYIPLNTSHMSQLSDFHRRSDFCGTCHDIDNPIYGGEPIERTYTEWKYSAYGIYAPDGQETTCQDCHMPAVEGGYACAIKEARVQRARVYRHDFAGGTSCVQDMLIYLYDLDPATKRALEASKEKAQTMLQKAAELELVQKGAGLQVKVINLAGHKLPTGYSEGRRMWLNVRFLDSSGKVIKESGAYDFNKAELIPDPDLKAYEIKPGIKYTGDPEAFPDKLGISEGPSFHFAANNHIYQDNRIPPKGFKNQDYVEHKAFIRGASYEDDQNWDITIYDIPDGAASAEVILYYQTVTRDYIGFLYEENAGNQWDYFDAGTKLLEAWMNTGKCEPTEMAGATIEF